MSIPIQLCSQSEEVCVCAKVSALCKYKLVIHLCWVSSFIWLMNDIILATHAIHDTRYTRAVLNRGVDLSLCLESVFKLLDLYLTKKMYINKNIYELGHR